MSINPTDGPKNASSTTFNNGLTSILYTEGLSVICKSAKVSFNVSWSALNTYIELVSLHRGQANDTYLSIEFVQRFQNKVHE